MFDTLEERVSFLSGPLQQWAAVDLATVPPATVPGDVEALLMMRDMLDGEIMRRLAVADRSGEAGLLAGPNGSTAAWLCDVRRMDHTDAAALVRTARKLSDLLPETAAALSEGEISLAHAKVLARAVTPARATAAEAGYGGGMAQAETDLVAVAILDNPAKLAETATSWAHAIDPEPVARKQEEQYAARELYLSRTFEGMLDIKGQGDAASAEAIVTAVEALAKPKAAGDDRTMPQRRYDALVELCTQALSGDTLPDVAGERPQVIVTVDLAALELRAGAAAAQLGHLGPITGETARRFACDAGISRVITDGPSEVVDVGRKTRSIGPNTRRALIVRDGGCKYPGCDRPVSWSEIHHLVHWVDGGDTDLDNLVMLCRRHHRLLHEGRQTLHPKPDGSWTLAPYEPPAQPTETSVGSYGEPPDSDSGEPPDSDSGEPPDGDDPPPDTCRPRETVSQQELDEFWGIERDDDGVPLVAPRVPKPPPTEPSEDPF